MEASYLKFSPAAINVVTLSACLTNHTAAPAAHGGRAEERRLALFRAAVINVQLIGLTPPVQEQLLWAAGLLEECAAVCGYLLSLSDTATHRISTHRKMIFFNHIWKKETIFVDV